MSQEVEVTVIIPNYNGKKLLENCIRTLEQQTCMNFKLLIVDNGSTDGSTRLTSELLDMEMICLKENTGFCGAVNIGLAHTVTPYAILLNNDTEADSRFVEELLFGIKSRKDLFSCGAMMIDFRRREIIDNAGDLYTVLGWAVARGKGRPVTAFGKEAAIFSSCGGAAIYRMEAIRKIGVLDEQHFAYLEDVDLGYRARIYGYKNRYLPKAKVYHVGSATTGTQYNEKKVFLAARNSIYLIYKNMPVLQLLINLPFLILGVLVKLLFFVRKGFAGEYLEGIKKGIAGCPKCRKVRFHFCNFGNYIRIELELFWNIIKVIVLKIKS